jgi:monoterpene epsilon-lactone hydrolase
VSADWVLPALRQGHPADADLLDRRARAGGSGDVAEVSEAVLGGSRCLLVEPAGRTAEGDILYLHGGGYRLGSPRAYSGYGQRLADRSGRRVVLPYYPLAPENPFPAALHAVAAVYRNLSDPAGTIIAGDSAGGGLTAALCILAARAGQRPAGAILVSPMLDLTASADSLERNAARDPVFSKAAVLDSARLYLQGHDPRDPLVSALNADPADFPPVLVLTGGAEVLLDEALAFAGKLARADIRMTLHVAPGMGHVWPLLAPDSPAADEAVSAMAEFVKSRKSVHSDVST